METKRNETTTQTAQDLVNESEGLTFEEKTPVFLSKLAKGELKTEVVA